MTHRLLLIACCLSLLTLGCGQKRDEKAEFDDQVRNELPQYKRVDAITFFEGGGHFWNVDAEGEPPIDEEHVLPLVKALRSEAGLKSEVLVGNRDGGFALKLLVPVPADEDNQSRMEGVISRADARFPGAILRQQGYEWFSLEFLDADEVALIRHKAGDILGK